VSTLQTPYEVNPLLLALNLYYLVDDFLLSGARGTPRQNHSSHTDPEVVLVGLVIKTVCFARGHPLVKAEHSTTIGITTEGRMTEKGDCIVAVGCDKSPRDFQHEFKSFLRKSKRVEIELICSGISEKIVGSGSNGLSLDHEKEMVIRKSDYECPKTIAIKADKASIDLDRRLIDEIKTGKPVEMWISLHF